jgi:uncharacterized protein (TIGR02677 family)
LNPSRHLLTNDESLERAEAAGVHPGTSWFDAPPMQISVRLRATGSHARKGRPPAIVDRTEQKRLLAQFAAAESAQIERARRVLAQGRPVLLSQIGTLDSGEFDLFLEILGEALAMKGRPQDAVEITSSDGALRIRLEPLSGTPGAGIAVIRTPAGDFSGPDHAITIEPVLAGESRHDAIHNFTFA